jgi:hypothetical protein
MRDHFHRLEGKAELFVEVAVPADRAFVGRVGIDDDFVLDAVLADRAGLRHKYRREASARADMALMPRGVRE